MPLGLATLTPKFMVNPRASTSPSVIAVTDAVGFCTPESDAQPVASAQQPISGNKARARNIGAVYCRSRGEGNGQVETPSRFRGASSGLRADEQDDVVGHHGPAQLVAEDPD